MLRLRRREVTVSSTLLWQKLMRDREANAPWQKLRKNWLLILQLLILGLLVLALARPFLPVATVVNGNIVVLLDGSASMAATDVEPTRFGAAQSEVSKLIGELSGSDEMTLILVGQTPRVLASATNDRTILRSALEGAAVDAASGNWQAAFALATGASQGYRDAKIVIVSDGGISSELPPLPVEAIHVPIGVSMANLAITALATRETDEGVQLFTSVTNYGVLDQSTLLSLQLGDTLFDSKRIDVPADSSANFTWLLPADTTLIEARLSDQTDDNLPTDDIAWAVHEGGVSNNAVLITEGNIFLEQVYSALPGMSVVKAAPDAELTDTYDLYIYDGVPLPDEIPASDLLIIAPPESNSLLTVSGTISNTATTRLADSRLLQFVDWAGVDIREAQNVQADWAQALVSAESGPLILAGERSGYRTVIITFDLLDSDLPLQVAFPILMANLTNWLNPGRAFDALGGVRVGGAVPIAPGPGTTVVSVEKPSGDNWRADVGEEDIIFAETDALGVYNVTLRDDGGNREAGSFAVNLFAPSESNIRPAENIRVGFETVEEAQEGNIGQRELWYWLAVLAFVVLIVEWWVYHRGLVWPNLRAEWMSLRGFFRPKTNR